MTWKEGFCRTKAMYELVYSVLTEYPNEQDEPYFSEFMKNYYSNAFKEEQINNLISTLKQLSVLQIEEEEKKIVAYSFNSLVTFEMICDEEEKNVSRLISQTERLKLLDTFISAQSKCQRELEKIFQKISLNCSTEEKKLESIKNKISTYEDLKSNKQNSEIKKYEERLDFIYKKKQQYLEALKLLNEEENRLVNLIEKKSASNDRESKVKILIFNFFFIFHILYFFFFFKLFLFLIF